MNHSPNRSTDKTPPVIEMGPRRGGGPMAARMNAEKPKKTLPTIKRLLHYIGRSGVILIALVLIMLAVTCADLLGPFFQAKAIDTIKIDDVTGKLTVDMNALQGYLVLMAVIFLCSAVLSYFQGILAARLSQSTVRTMRNDLFCKISKLPIRYTDTHRHGDIMSRMTNDVENVSNAISQSVSTLFSCVLTLIGALTMMLYYSPAMTLDLYFLTAWQIYAQIFCPPPTSAGTTERTGRGNRHLV